MSRTRRRIRARTGSGVAKAGSRTYDVTVAASSDNEHFEQAAVRAVEGWLYEPARFQDAPIDAGRNVVLTFEIDGQKGAHRAFIKQQRQLVERVAEGDRVAATELLETLFQRERNLFEEAYLHLATYDYHVKWGTPDQQLHALSRAAFVDKGREFLPQGVLTNVLTRKFALELKTNRLAQAQRTADRLLERRVKQDTRQALQRALAEIDAVATSDQGVAVSGHIGRTLRYVHPLLKRTFEIQDVQGRIAELHLHCARDYVGFGFQPDLRYHVEPDQTDCRVIVIGDPDTRFTLLES